jgi:hypothetical protein
LRTAKSQGIIKLLLLLILVECRLKTRAPNVKVITVLVIMGKTYIEENWGVEVCGQPKHQPRIWALIRKTGQSCKEDHLYKGSEVVKIN